jgi:hypothetical protein
VVHGEDERPLDETVEHYPMLIRIDRRHPGMMPLEMQTIRCNDPMQVLPWRHRRGRFFERTRMIARGSGQTTIAKTWFRAA